ncbi:phage major capsid protein, HK97 family [Nakamurella panacisegetis]|uniref:Phage major capsid protein, HK97 family n=1 Tax=Nakamurella panacisegetis TaxID=1090615 RepID=A0A1H0PY58_9ACTN|nr:phage major capsid protein [Nakamurella panacisegetis]SDP09446.1 phage major capsid protein, HK97 family [Nakamurella panacisegetis]
MAVTAPTKLSDFAGFLNREQSAPIFERAARSSFVQRLGTQVQLGINGQSIPVVTGRIAASWTGEGAPKGVSSAAVALKTMDPKKLTAIAVVSAEVVRANPAGYMDLVKNQVGEAFATAFDLAAAHGTGSPFSTNLDTGSTAVELTGTTPAATAVYDDLNAGLGVLVNADKLWTGSAFDNRFEPILNGAKDTAGRPLFLEAPYTEEAGPIRAGRLLGRPSFLSPGIYSATPKILGYAGDWSQVAWGAVGGITYKVSTEAAVTINGVLTSLFENNLVAILAEAEYGFLVNDAASIVRFTNAV